VADRGEELRAAADLGLGPLAEAGELGVRKPDPRIFREALLRLGTEPAETVFVGDRLYDDIGGAHAVGMRAVLTRQWRQEDDPEFEPDAVIDDLGELDDALQKWGGPPAR